MSSQQFDDLRDQQQLDWIASELNVDPDELSELQFYLDENSGHDGVVYGYRVTFADESDPQVLNKIAGLQHGRWVNIGFPPDDAGEE